MMKAPTDQPLNSSVLFDQKPARPSFLQWWYNLTSIPEPPADASFVKRETVRRSRLLSLLILFMLTLFVVFLPAALTPPIRPGTFSTLAIFPLCLTAILLNRSQKVFAAATVMVTVTELALSLVIATTQPSDELSLSLYYLLIIGELLAVSLLPPSSVLFATIYNMAFTITTILLLHHTPTLTLILHKQLATIIARPVAVQFLVAAVSYLWVNSTLRAISRADRAEVIASLERQITQQSIQAAEEKRRLEENINQIVQSHIDTMNNKVVTRIPFSEDMKLLWPLINVFDSLQKRLRTAQQTEYELQRLKQAIAGYTNLVYNDRLTPQQPWPQTKTDLDSLIYAIRHKDPLYLNTTAEQGKSPSSHKWRGMYPRYK